MRALLVSLALLIPHTLVACSGSSSNADPGSGGSGGQTPLPDGGNQQNCNPAATAFNSQISPIIEQKCGECHGTQTDFGAPFSLLNHANLVAGNPGQRIVDRMVTAVQEFRMPPPGNPQLTSTELETLLDWASCGTAEADPTRGLRASRPVWESPPEPSAGLRRIELTAKEYVVARDLGEKYENFYFENLVQQDQFIRRFDAVIDESRVVHHITAHYTSDDAYLYAWAPGTGAVEFPDGGLRLRPGDRFRIEIHYNNGARLENVRDSSGIVFYVADPAGTEYGMADPTTFNIVVPPQSEHTVTKDCVASRDYTILAGMPHMHQIGKSFSHEILRQDGSKEEIISLDGWSFELQYFYDLRKTVKAGDTLRLRCTYYNPTSQTVRGGTNTTNEMCYNFMYVTPADARAECPGLF
ncbi:MAG TPA: hypothetical protein VI072_11035 [Polyangiaceae bacterium]